MENKLSKLKKKVKKHLRVDMKEYREAISDDKKLLKTMSSKFNRAASIRRSSRSR